MKGIVLNKVSVRFPTAKDPMLKDINLSVAEGECILLTGPCGCGKSTLLRLINGIVPHVVPGEISGTINVNGHIPAQEKIWRLGRTVATVYQNPRHQFFCAQPLYELAFGSENAGQEPEEILSRAKNIAQDLAILPLLNRSMFTLSGGELQRVAIGSALMDQPGFLLLDEPTSSLDTKNIHALASILRRLRAQGMTIIIAEHRLWFLRDVVDRVIRLTHGRIVEDVSAAIFWQREDALRREQGLRSLTQPITETLTEPPVDSIKGLTYPYSEQRILHFPRGAVTALCGENGIGKTTLAKHVSGLKRTHHQILLDGRPLSPKKRLRRTFLVLQDVNQQLFGASVAQELQMGRQFIRKQSLDQVIKDMELSKLLDRHPMALSGGQQQQVVVALALLQQQDILIFDEPTSGLDYAQLVRVAKRLNQLANAGKVIILITHDQELIALCADYQIILSN